MKWRIFRLSALWCWHQLLTLALFLLVLVAVLVGVGRQVLPAVSGYRAEVEARASKAMGAPVRVQVLSGAWEGMGPSFRLRGVQLRDPAAPSRVLLNIPAIDLRLALWQSLRHWEPRVDVRVYGVNVHIEQRADGHVQVRELSRLASHDPQAAVRTLRAVLRQPALALLQSRVSIAVGALPPITLHQLNVVSHNVGDSHDLSGSFLLAGSPEKVDVRVALQGDPAAWQSSQIKLWLHLPVLRMEQWLPAHLSAAPISISRLAGGGDYWLRLQNGQMQAAQAKLNWRDVVLRYAPSAATALQELHVQELHVQELKGWVSWEHKNLPNHRSWQLSGSALQGRVNGVLWPLPNMAISFSGEPALTSAAESSSEPTVKWANEQLSFAVARANVAGVAQLLPALAALPAPLGTWLHDAAPSGELAALRVDIARTVPAQTALTEPAGWQPQRVDVQAQQLTLHSTAAYPGVQRLSAWARWTPATAWLGVNNKGSVVELPQVFREPVQVHALRGHLRLQTQPEQWQLRSDHWQLRNADARGTGVFALDIPRADPTAAQLHLLARIEQASAASTWRYVPWPSAGEGTLHWLREGITGGTVRQGDFLYAGPVHLRPDLGPHRLQMRFALENGRLNYAAGWPPLHGLNATVTLDGTTLTVQSPHTNLLSSSEGHAITASIANLHQPQLQVSADIRSNGADVMQLFRDSPLKVPLAGVISSLDAQGPIAAHLDLHMPLHPANHEPVLPVVSVVAQLQGNRLTIKPADLVASNVQGELRYHTQHGLQAPQLRAQLLEAPVTASISSQPNRQAGQEGGLSTVDVGVRGQASVPALRRWWSSPLLSLASGSLPYEATVHIAHNEPAPRLLVTSNLAGVALSLPAPLGKTAAELVPLRYQSTVGAGEQLAKVQYGKRLAAGVVWREGFLDRALLRLGSTDAAWPAQRGIEVEGRLPSINAQDWSPWLQRVQGLVAGMAAGRKNTPALPALTRVDVDSRELLGAGLRLQDAHLSLRRESSAWRVALSSNELQGGALWPDNPSADIRVSFSRLPWPLPAASNTSASNTSASNTSASNTGASNTASINTGSISTTAASASASSASANTSASAATNTAAFAALGNRPVFIDGQGLRLAAWPGLGVLAVKARILPSAYGVRVDDVVLDSRDLGFKGRVDWQWRGGNHSRVRGVASSPDVAGLLRGLGYAPSLASPNAAATIDMGWQAAPDTLDAATLEGSVALTVEQGHLLNVSRGATASRVFGWFDVDNLKRRFKGDFSDVLKRGLAFDKASLAGVIQAGVMPAAVFKVDGPTLKAQGQGRLDLARQQMDQVFSVTLPVTSAVPLAAIVVAGPLIGGAIAAAQMTFNKQIDKATQLRYRVSGAWNNPVIERISQKKAESVKAANAPAALAPAIQVPVIQVPVIQAPAQAPVQAKPVQIPAQVPPAQTAPVASPSAEPPASTGASAAPATSATPVTPAPAASITPAKGNAP